jgi:hypothetical protein
MMRFRFVTRSASDSSRRAHLSNVASTSMLAAVRLTLASAFRALSRLNRRASISAAVNPCVPIPVSVGWAKRKQTALRAVRDMM